MFMTSLFELKYMGYISQTKQSTYIFKKNFFGKVKQHKMNQKSDEQLDNEKKDIMR